MVLRGSGGARMRKTTPAVFAASTTPSHFVASSDGEGAPRTRTPTSAMPLRATMFAMTQLWDARLVLAIVNSSVFCPAASELLQTPLSKTTIELVCKIRGIGLSLNIRLPVVFVLVLFRRAGEEKDAHE
eukprot:CAMPEP_0173177184 /NCGR_PEP_ID=MMETSP1141-20130122/4856_1 /TAXON_ID=483371 /ORGANISM="non described non described, Strain CCMP2298" /LENGTH=128 /DNA_ID=CAMNT_0014099569 /DNA_START=90 /DNA_END=475 /DNA_ORIENTATION=-